MTTMRTNCTRTTTYRRDIEGSDDMRMALGGGALSTPRQTNWASSPSVAYGSTFAAAREASKFEGGSRNQRALAVLEVDKLTPNTGSKRAVHGKNTERRPMTLSQKRFDSMKVTDTFQTVSDKGLPCHVQHGSVRNEIQWDVSPEEILSRVWPLMTTAASGLRVRTHPQAIKSRKSFADLCSIVTTCEPAALRTVTVHIRAALIDGLTNNTDKTFDVFFAALEALTQLSDRLHEHLTPFLSPLLVPLASARRHKQTRERIDTLLDRLCQNGGDQVMKLVKAKIPCFTDMK